MFRVRLLLPLLALAGLLLLHFGIASSASGPGPVAYFPLVPQNGYLASPTSAPGASRGPYASGSVGYDTSFPSCGSPPPPATSSTGVPYSFAIIGVNDGRAFTRNPCLASEFDNAVSRNLLASFYVNINAPLGSTADRGNTGPKGSCASGDLMCLSYNYGYNAAAYAHDAAASALGTPAVAGRVWWLDVELANSWWTDLAPPTPTPVPSGNTLDDQVILGAIAYYQQNGMTVGSYSIASMWAQGAPRPAGGMGVASISQVLHTQILGSFQTGIPEWVSGAPDLASAPSYCGGSSFTGGPIWVVQDPSSNTYDENYAC